MLLSVEVQVQMPTSDRPARAGDRWKAWSASESASGLAVIVFPSIVRIGIKMKKRPVVGLTHELSYRVPTTKTVPYVFDDSEYFASMPQVFATAFLVGLVERTCVEALHPYVDYPDEITVGTHISVSHKAATPPGLTVRVRVEVAGVEGNRITFAVSAHDGLDEISHGLHERTIVGQRDFESAAVEKLRAVNM